jgi:hypothetical protein
MKFSVGQPVLIVRIDGDVEFTRGSVLKASNAARGMIPLIRATVVDIHPSGDYYKLGVHARGVTRDWIWEGFIEAAPVIDTLAGLG